MWGRRPSPDFPGTTAADRDSWGPPRFGATHSVMERILRGIAGFVVLLSVVLLWSSHEVDLLRPTWAWLTTFVGLNLLQSALTDWCPMMWFLGKLGVRRAGA